MVTLSKVLGLESYSVLDHAGSAIRQQVAAAAKGTSTAAGVEAIRGMATRTMFQCLVSLGDLSRYCISSGEPSGDEKDGRLAEAAQYYRQASRLIHEDGTPHNQLAVLECARAPVNKVDVIFHYCCSMAAQLPGASTATNIREFFQKHRSRQFPIPAQPACSRTDVVKLQQARVTTAQQFVAEFVALHDLLWTDDATLGSVSFETASSLLLSQFDLVLTATWLGSAESIGADMNKNGMFSSVQLQKIMAINICTVSNLQQSQQQSEAGHAGGKIDRALFLAFRMLSQLMVWLSQAANHEDGNIEFDDYSAAIRLALQWLHDKEMLRSIFETRQTAGSTQKLWAAIAVLLNSRPAILWEQQEGDLQQHQPSAEPGSETKEAALPEDYDFRGFAPLNGGRVRIDFSLPPTPPPTDTMPSVRTRSTFALARSLAGRPNSGVQLGDDGRTTEGVAVDKSMILPHFLGGLAGGGQAGSSSSKLTAFAAGGTSSSDKERFMKAMAQQRLQEQVHTLASSVAAAASTQPALPPFVCVDTKTSIYHLRLIQELIKMQRFVVVVPLAVISGLDGLKKGSSRENKGAREATRWLEHTFKQGEPGLRAQLRDESADPPFVPAANTPSEALRILSCCVHFGYHKSGRGGMVTLLTNDSRLSTLARQAGVRTDQIETFAKLAAK